MVCAVGIVALAGLQFFEGGGAGITHDNVDAAETARRAGLLAAAGSIALPPVAPHDIAAAADQLGLPAAARQALLADAESQRVRLVWLSLYDSDAEDGDVVDITTSGFSYRLRLTRKPVAIAVPLAPGARIQLTGAIDGGGGGVTVGVIAPGGPLPLPPLSVGQTIDLPVVVR
jgi:hypothetical protein